MPELKVNYFYFVNLETGEVFEGREEDFDPNDSVWHFRIYYNGQRSVHAVLAHNSRNGCHGALIDASFDPVDLALAESRSYQTEPIDSPLETDKVFLLKKETDLGAEVYWKISSLSEGESSVLIKYAKL